MVKVKLGDDIIQSKIRFRVRFDYRGNINQANFYLEENLSSRQHKMPERNKLRF